MRFPFYKMHGAANDFILLDDRSNQFPAHDTAWIARMAARRTGVGCEGVILIQSSAQADFRMRFFNPDGHEVEMCGNGARCVARLAHDLGIAPADMRIETVAGTIAARVGADGRVTLALTPPKDWRLHRHLFVQDRWYEYHFVNTGVPHAVIVVENLSEVPVAELGRAIRYHADFAPAGTNVDFVQAAGPDELRVRTYERGVEAETLACGTGMAAVAVVMARLGQVAFPVRVIPASGDVLIADARTEAGWDRLDVTLNGPAEYVFEGVLDYPGPLRPGALPGDGEEGRGADPAAR
jgi:diaminopimelate epimerase